MESHDQNVIKATVQASWVILLIHFKVAGGYTGHFCLSPLSSCYAFFIYFAMIAAVLFALKSSHGSVRLRLPSLCSQPVEAAASLVLNLVLLLTFFGELF